MKNFTRALAVGLLIAAPLASAGSFNSIRNRVYADPLSKLPTESGLGVVSFAKAFVAESGEIVDRSQATFEDASDFRPARPKLLHPRGVCAEVTWSIDKRTEFTGLFAPGTLVHGIIRMSSGTSDSALSQAKTRMFGLALKLFPTQDDDQKVVTRNVFTLDNYGFEKSDRPYFLQKRSRDEPLYFTNFAPPHSTLGKLANNFFARFDWHPEHRPLYPLAEVDSLGQDVDDPVIPFEMHLVPVADRPHASFDDFRTELLSYDAGDIQFDIELPSEKYDYAFAKVGTVTLGEPVVSTFCDEELHFHHHPNNRKHSKTDP